MKSKYNIINKYDWISQLFKLFLLIILFYLFKKNIQSGLIVTIVSLLIYYNYDFESFTETTNLPIDVSKLNYNKIYIPIDIYEKTHRITKLALKDKKLRKIIENKMVKIYGEIQNNNKLKRYLKFMNLINENGMPIFINEDDEVSLNNKIKIILIT